MSNLERRPLSREAAREIAALVGLTLTGEQLARLQGELEAMARNLARLDEVDVRGVEPAISFRLAEDGA